MEHESGHNRPAVSGQKQTSTFSGCDLKCTIYLQVILAESRLLRCVSLSEGNKQTKTNQCSRVRSSTEQVIKIKTLTERTVPLLSRGSAGFSGHSCRRRRHAPERAGLRWLLSGRADSDDRITVQGRAGPQAAGAGSSRCQGSCQQTAVELEEMTHDATSAVVCDVITYSTEKRTVVPTADTT